MMRNLAPILGVVTALLLSSALSAAPQQDSSHSEEAQGGASASEQEGAQEPEGEDAQEQEATEEEEGTDPASQPPSGKSRSGYEGIAATSGSSGVQADLLADSLEKRPVIKLLSGVTNKLFDFKDKINGLWGIAFGVDYNFLNQYASFSFTEDEATSGNIRFYGTWNLFHSKEKIHGNFVFRVENRHLIGSGITPRDLGFDAGSALSTASFKDFDWGVSSLYWDQILWDRKVGLVFGQMDPGDFMDAFPLLSAWTYFMSDAFFNNPAEALPQQGVGFVTRVYLDENYYVMGGIHDALADADGLDVAQLFDGEDYFYWLEVGWSPSWKSDPGDSIHLTVWEQDPLVEKGTERSQGIAFSYAPKLFGRYRPFFRAGYSNGDAALMRRIFAVGVGIDFRDGNDLLGIATSYGAPVDRTAGSQSTSEFFYRLQLAEHLQVTPALQVTFNPSFNDVKDALYVGSVLRMRLAF